MQAGRTCITELLLNPRPCPSLLQAGRTCIIEVVLDKDDCSRELLEFGARLSFQSSNASQIAQ